ncbi:MAG: tetratricopeptide repeat protein [Planctomycetes bacterium]|nr:tetratricopeptide repeat protein [Planctomycetota bacterium]
MTDGSSARSKLYAFALLVAVCVAFANSFAGVLLFDDVPDIVLNPALRQLWPPTSDLWAVPGCGLTGRPVVAFSFALNYAVSELGTWSYHATNLAIHAAATLFLFASVRALCDLPRATAWMRERRDVLAFGTALLWAVHPLQVSAVTLVIQRCESLMGLFFLAGLWAALRSLRATSSRGWIAFAVACAALGAGTKESIAMLPIVAFVLDWAFASGSPGAAWRAHRGLYLALALVFPLVALSVVFGGIHRVTGEGVVQEVTWWVWITAQPPAILEYLRLVFVPTPILVDYGWPIPRSLGAWLPHAGVLAALLGATAWACVRFPRVGVLAASFFLLLAPASSLVPIPFELYALHRMYLPLACITGLLVAALLRASGERRALALGVLVVAALASGWMTQRANANFASEERMWRATLEHLPDNDRAWAHLGDALEARQQIEDARAAYQRAVDLHPEYPLWYNNLARFEAQLGRLDDAVAHWKRAVELLPGATLERDNLARALAMRGDFAGALEHYERLVAVDPTSAVFQLGRGRALVRLGRSGEALDAFTRAHAAAPDDPGVFECLVMLRATSSDASVRDGAEALRLVDAAGPALTSFQTATARLRGAALAECGRFDEAIAEVERALRLVGPNGPPPLVAELERERELYRSGQPMRDAVP